MAFSPFPSLPLRKEQSSSGSLVIINSQDNVYQINPLREDLHDEPISPFFLSFFFTEKKKKSPSPRSGKIRATEFGCACLQISKCQQF